MLDSTRPPNSTPRTRARQRILLVTRWLIPPIFACAAALLHFEFHVPRSPMVPRAKEDKKKKAKPRAPKKAAKERKPWQPREQAELDKLRVRWEKEAFVDEPDDVDFRRQHDTLLRAVTQIAREAALDQSPNSMRVTPHCKTIRCSLQVCGPAPAVDAIAGMLPKVERHDGPLWHELREVEPDVEAPISTPKNTEAAEVEAEQRSCRAWVVGFRVDGTKRRELKIAGQEPEPTPEPTKPRDSTVPQGPGPEPG
jgi:hypothetical protein